MVLQQDMQANSVSYPDMPRVLLITAELYLPNAHSLKQKRSSVKACIERLKKSLNASVAEIGYRDKWQRSVIALSIVGVEKQYLEKAVHSVENIVIQLPELSLVRLERHWL